MMYIQVFRQVIKKLTIKTAGIQNPLCYTSIFSLCPTWFNYTSLFQRTKDLPLETLL